MESIHVPLCFCSVLDKAPELFYNGCCPRKGECALEKLKAYLERNREAVTYLFFGGLTTLVNIAAYKLLDRMGLETGPATTIATVLSILFAYFTNRRWVFESRAHGSAAWKEFGSFVACRLVTLVLDFIIMTYGVDKLGPHLVAPHQMDLWKLFVKVLANVIVILINYIFSKLIIFRKKQ